MGLAVNQDCQLVEATANQQENVIIAVSIGEVDAGFIRGSAFHEADEFIAPGPIKIIAKTARQPNWAVFVNRNLPIEEKEALRTALRKLNNEDRVMQAMELDGFKTAKDSDYDVIRQVINEQI